MAGARRRRDLDGLRGVAALAVVLSHLVKTEFPGRGIDGIGLPLLPVYDGRLAVCVFFLISGMVLWRPDTVPPLPIAVARRYVRLTLPILASGVLALALALGSAGAALSGGGLLAWLIESVGGIYVTGWSDWNPSLWTMQIEFIGSILIFLGARLWPLLGLARLLGAALLLNLALLARPRFVLLDLFLLGAMMPSLGPRVGRMTRSRRELLGMGALTLALGLDTCLMESFTAAALLLLVAVELSPALQHGLESAWPDALGRHAFGLYLVHYPIMLFSHRALVSSGLAPTPIRIALEILLSGAAIAVVAPLITRFVDRPAIALSRRIGRR